MERTLAGGGTASGGTVVAAGTSAGDDDVEVDVDSVGVAATAE
jgi:hypothetical protein